MPPPAANDAGRDGYANNRCFTCGAGCARLAGNKPCECLELSATPPPLVATGTLDSCSAASFEALEPAPDPDRRRPDDPPRPPTAACLAELCVWLAGFWA